MLVVSLLVAVSRLWHMLIRPSPEDLELGIFGLWSYGIRDFRGCGGCMEFFGCLSRGSVEFSSRQDHDLRNFAAGMEFLGRPNPQVRAEPLAMPSRLVLHMQLAHGRARDVFF